MILVVLILIPAEKLDLFGKKDQPGQSIQSEIPEKVVIEEPEQVPEPSDHFFIIAGSFKHLGNASELQDKLKARGYPAEVMITGNRMYRVSVASFTTRSEAESSLVRMKSEPEMEACWLLSKE